MADIVREIEITAALSSDYQAAFSAASSIARDTASELSQLTKREADLAKMSELASKAAEAAASGRSQDAEKLSKQYNMLADKLGMTDRSAAALDAEFARIGARRKEVEALNRSASKSAEIGRLAKQIKQYTDAAEKVKDPALLAQLEKLKKRFKELGGSLPDKKKPAGFLQMLKGGLAQLPGPLGNVMRDAAATGDVLKSAFSTTGGKAALAVAGVAAIAVAAVEAGKKIWELGRQTIQTGDRIAKTSAQLGIASGAYQELSYAAGLGGASESDFDTALRTLNKQMEGAVQGNQKAVKAFKSLGISMDEVKAMNTEEMFMRLSDALSGVDDVASKTRTTMQLFGGAGDKVAYAISGGSEALAKIRDEARKAGYVMSPEALKKSEEATDNFTRAQLQMQGAMRQIGVEAMPAINEALVSVVQLIRENKEEFSEFAHIIGVAFTGGVYAAVKAVQGVTIAINSVISGIKFWQDKFVKFLEFIVPKLEGFGDIFTETIPNAFSEGIALLKEKFAAVRQWITGIVDTISEEILGRLRGIADSLRDTPLIGRLFEGSSPTVQGGNVQITVNNSVDARGAVPGAGAEIGRAVQTGAASSGEVIAGAISSFDRLSYSGGAR